MTTPEPLFTAEDLMQLPEIECRYELVNGQLVTLPFFELEHGFVLAELGVAVHQYVRRTGAGRAAMRTGVILRRGPDTVLAPDLCFVRRDRLPADRRGYLAVAPDFVAEVVSFNDLTDDLQARIVAWLEAGVRLVWVLYPAAQMVYAYRSVTDVRVYTAEDTLDGGDVLPGFACAVAGLFGSM